MSLISIGLSGLNASSAAMNTIGNNTANVDTVGYSRQQVMTTATQSQNIGVGYIGTGTTLSDVRRIYNGFLDTQLQTSTGLNADAAAYLAQASKLDSILSESSTGINQVLSSFFTSMQAVAQNANDTAARNTYLKSAQNLSTQFNSISSQMQAQNKTVNDQLVSMTSQVNALSASIATLNQQITQVKASGATPNSLLDSREEAVRQLNELVGAKAVEGGSGYDVYIGSGQSLVTGSTSYTLSAVPSANDPTTYAVKLNNQSGTTDLTAALTGGSIGGLIRYRRDVLEPASNELGRLALVVSDQVNTQLNQGVDSNGAFGTDLFKNINDPALVGNRSVGYATNPSPTSNLNVTITDTGKLTTSDYQVIFSGSDASGNATSFTVKSLPDGTSKGTFDVSDTSQAALKALGFSLSYVNTTDKTVPPLPVRFKQGDVFTISPTGNGAKDIKTVLTDTKTIAAAAPLTGTASVNKGTGAFTQPTLLTPANIYDTPGTAAMRTAIQSASPMRLVFGDVVAGAQSYKLVDATGNAVNDKNGVAITGNIVPGQVNALEFNVGYGAGQSFKIGMSVSGSPTSADTYNIGMTAPGSADNRNANATLALQSKQTVDVASGNGTGMSMSAANTKMIQGVGALAAQAKNDSAATSTILTQAKSARDSVSGVSMDEEAANLVKYQQYYTASSQIIKAAQSIFDTLINSL